VNTGGNPNSTRTAALIVVAVLAFFALLGGGAWLVLRSAFPPVSLPEPPKTLPSPWPESGGEPVREVPMPTGEMAAALPDRTASHVLCSSLPEQTWAAVLGGPVLREARVLYGCQVVTPTLRVSAELSDGKQVHPGGPPERAGIGGREATSYGSSDGKGATVVVQLLGPSPPTWTKSVLELSIRQDTWDRTSRDLPAMVRTLGDGMVDAITGPGPPIPTAPPGDAIPVQATEPIPGSGIVDAATPMIAWQLCSALSRSTARPLDEFVPKHDGSCEYREDKEFGVVASSGDCCEKSFPDTLGGRPASVDNPSVTIQLTDDSRQEVKLAWLYPRKSDAELRAWAESMIPQLLGR
jgi:hypothetical protein